MTIFILKKFKLFLCLFCYLLIASCSTDKNTNFKLPNNKDELKTALIGSWKSEKGHVIDLDINKITIKESGEFTKEYGILLDVLTLGLAFIDNPGADIGADVAQAQGNATKPTIRYIDKNHIHYVIPRLKAKYGFLSITFVPDGGENITVYEINFDKTGSLMTWKFIEYIPPRLEIFGSEGTGEFSRINN